MSFSAGSMVADLALNTSSYAKGMLQATALAQVFPSTVTNFLANPLLGWVNIAKDAAQGVGNALGDAMGFIKDSILQVAESAHSMGVEADKAGVSAQFLAHVGAAARTVNLPVEEVGRAMAFLSRNASEAAKGNEAMMMTFAQLGIVVTDSTGHFKDTQQLFSEVTDAIAGLGDPATQIAMAMDLMGKGGEQMTPLLKKGTAGIDAMAKVMKAAAGGMSSDVVGISDKAVMLHQVWDAAWDGIRQTVAKPILTEVAKHADSLQSGMILVAAKIRGAIETVFDYIESHRGEITATFSTVSAVVSSALNTVWGYLKPVGAFITGTLIPALQSGLTTAFRFVVAHLEEIKGGLIGLGLPVLFTVVSSIVSVVGSAAAALGGPVVVLAAIGVAAGVLAARLGLLHPIIEWVKGTAVPAIRDGLGQAFQFLKPVFDAAGQAMQQLWEKIKPVFGYIQNVAAPAIGQVLTQAFQRVRPFLYEVRDDFVKYIGVMEKAYEFIITNIVPAVKDKLVDAFTELEPTLGKAWDLFTNLYETFKTVGGYVGEQLAPVLKAIGTWAEPAAQAWLTQLKLVGKFIGFVIDQVNALVNLIRTHAKELTSLSALSGIGAIRALVTHTSGPPAPSGVATGLQAGGINSLAVGVPQSLNNLGNSIVTAGHNAIAQRSNQPVQVKIDKVHVDAVDPGRVSHAVSDAVRPIIWQAKAKAQKQLETASLAGVVGGAL